ncbi:MAG: hypothetical protein C4575_11590 [Desulforudis sp.]|nr:hypothetical protein [Clostridia bacterium]MDQ7791210.1 hypothetical protein [Clostridia bacterium]RJX17753.1 MAG: hypothetical protein C4575_11590 [Desulforudis sp.]
MRKFIIRGPGDACEEIKAESLDQAIIRAKQHHPNKHVSADASEVLYVCNPGEDPTICQNRLR